MTELWWLVPVYLFVINAVTYLAFWVDKKRAQQRAYRIAEHNLLALAIRGERRLQSSRNNICATKQRSSRSPQNCSLFRPFRSPLRLPWRCPDRSSGTGSWR